MYMHTVHVKYFYYYYYYYQYHLCLLQHSHSHRQYKATCLHSLPLSPTPSLSHARTRIPLQLPEYQRQISLAFLPIDGFHGGHDDGVMATSMIATPTQKKLTEREGREGGREGGREKEGGRRREGGRERGRERGREGGREGERGRGKSG